MEPATTSDKAQMGRPRKFDDAACLRIYADRVGGMKWDELVSTWKCSTYSISRAIERAKNLLPRVGA